MRRRDLLLTATVVMAGRAVRAQQKAMPVIGVLIGSSFAGPVWAALYQGLSETGYIEAKNVAIEYRLAEGRFHLLPDLAADLVRRQVDVIFASGEPAAHAAKDATSTIPIVFTSAGDPVAAGLVASFARPGGNLTGVTTMFADLLPKRLELLSELVPRASVFALLVDPNRLGTEPVIREMQDAARVKGVQLHIVQAGTESEIDTAFAGIVQRQIDALVIGPSQFFFLRHDQLVALAARHAIPASYEAREYIAAGGPISYGPNLSAYFRVLGTYVGKILNGAKPADLPVQQPTIFELVINLTTAKALGLTIPQTVLLRADEVIE